jgi:hypothetical protein
MTRAMPFAGGHVEMKGEGRHWLLLGRIEEVAHLSYRRGRTERASDRSG